MNCLILKYNLSVIITSTFASDYDSTAVNREQQ